VLSCIFFALTGFGVAVGANEPAFVKVVVLVNNTGGGTAQPSDFLVQLGLGYGSADPWSFDGSSKGTVSHVPPGTLPIHVSRNTQIENIPYSIQFSGDCVGKSEFAAGQIAISPGDKKTCIISAIYPNFD